MRRFRIWLRHSCIFLWVLQEKKVPSTYLIISLYRLSSLKNTLCGLSWWWDLGPHSVMFRICRCQLLCDHIHNSRWYQVRIHLGLRRRRSTFHSVTSATFCFRDWNPASPHLPAQFTHLPQELNLWWCALPRGTSSCCPFLRKSKLLWKL